MNVQRKDNGSNISDKEVKYLIKKSKGLIKDKKSIKSLKQNVVIMLRGNKIQVYENVKGGEFIVDDSSGEPRTYYMRNYSPLTLEYGADSAKCYVFSEDSPFPLPSVPKVNIDTIESVLEKIFMNVDSRKAKELRAVTGLIGKIIGGIAILVGLYIVYLLMFPKNNGDAIQVTRNVTQAIARNVTALS